ncbi:MAG: hypothetical protein IT229_11025 [Flavobacteriales bacterium]|nr:hypothetical protein [Flavobacteriales bacterium]
MVATSVLYLAWDFQGLYNQDAHSYLRLANELTAWWKGGGPPGQAYWPLGFPAAGAILSFLIGNTLLGLRLVTVFSWIMAVLAFRRILLDIGADRARAGLYTALTIGTSPFLLRHGVVVMSDVPAIGLALWSLRHGLRSKDLRDTLIGIAFAATAVMVRLPMLVWVAPVLMFSCLRAFQRATVGQRVLLTAMLVTGAVVVRWVVAGALAHPLGLQLLPGNLFRSAFDTVDGQHRFLVPNALYVLKPLWHPGFLLLAPLLWPFLRRGDLRSKLALLSFATAGGYLLFLGMLPDQNDRLCLPALPCVALVLWAAFDRVMFRYGGRRIWRMAVPLVVAVQLVLFARAIAPFVQQDRTQRELAEWVKGAGATTVYTFGVDQALRSYGFSGSTIDLWQNEVEHFKPSALVLFNPDANAEQWKGRTPMQNWQRALVQGADTVGTRPDGWVLLRVR